MRRLIAAFLVAAVSVATGAAETVSPAQMRGLAVRAIAEGRPDLAGGMADTLLQRDPSDVTALLIRSRALRDLGRSGAAADSARAAWDAADTDADRHRAALLVAQALSSGGKRTRAQFWLRRAAEVAPNDRAKARAINDFRYVRSRNPLAVKLSFDLAPTDNVNNGSTSEMFDLFGLPITLSGGARALSGLRFAAGADFSYRLRQTQRIRDDLSFGVVHQTYRLSDSAKQQAPNVSGSDFAYSQVTLGLTRRFAPAPGAGLYTFGLDLIGNWYGGAALSQGAALRAEKEIALDRRTRVTLGTRAGQRRYRTGNRDDVLSASFYGEMERTLEGGARLGFDAALSRNVSDSISYDVDRAAIGVEYVFGNPVLGAALTVAGGVEWSHYDATPYAIGSRRDLTTHASIGAVLPQFQTYGFAPILSVEGRWRSSNVDLFDSRSIGLRLGLQSVF